MYAITQCVSSGNALEMLCGTKCIAVEVDHILGDKQHDA